MITSVKNQGIDHALANPWRIFIRDWNTLKMSLEHNRDIDQFLRRFNGSLEMILAQPKLKPHNVFPDLPYQVSLCGHGEGLEVFPAQLDLETFAKQLDSWSISVQELITYVLDAGMRATSDYHVYCYSLHPELTVLAPAILYEVHNQALHLTWVGDNFVLDATITSYAK